VSIARQAVRGAAFVLASSYTNMGLGVVYGIIMARLLDPRHFGVFALAMFFYGLLDVRGKLGLDYAFIHRQPATTELVATHWTLQMGASALTLSLTGIGALIFRRLDYPPETAALMVGLAGAMLVEAAGSTARAGLEKDLAFGHSTLVVTTSLALSYLAGVGLALAGAGAWALAGQLAANAAFSTVGFWWAYRRRLPREGLRLKFDRGLARWLLRFGATLAVGAIATTVLLQFDNFLVGTLVGAVALGYYTQAYKVAQWPTGLVTHIIARAALPTYARLQNDPVRLSKAYEISLWAILTFATPLALAIFATAPDFLRLLFGEKWLPSALLLRCLIGYSVLRPLLDDTGGLFTAIGRPGRTTTVLATQAGVLVAFAVPLTLAYQAVGTAVAVGGAFVIGVALAYYFVSHTLAVPLGRLFMPPALAAAVSLALTFTLSSAVSLDGLPLLARVIGNGALAAGAFFAILLLLERGTAIERIRYLRRQLLAAG
jgi:O-antigen/teichoic acid export membrane protein